MLQRLVTGAALLWDAFAHLHAVSQVGSVGLPMFDAGVGILLLIGLWTPAVGVLIAGRELWAMFSTGGDPWMALVLATLGATLAMIGPGAWSLDAQLFGRRQIKKSS